VDLSSDRLLMMMMYFTYFNFLFCTFGSLKHTATGSSAPLTPLLLRLCPLDKQQGGLRRRVAGRFEEYNYAYARKLTHVFQNLASHRNDLVAHAVNREGKSTK
jgi:hypothetical protein